jgi:hypothetical protein
MMHMNTLRELLERDDYAVDPHKVADAIVQRLLATRTGEQPAARPGQ